MRTITPVVDSSPSALTRMLPAPIARVLTPERRRFIKFAIVGGSGVFVNLAVLALMMTFVVDGMDDRDLARRLAIGTAIVVSIFTNFLINDGWTWGDRPKHGVAHWLRRCTNFYVSASFAATVQFLVSELAARAIDIQNPVLGLPGEKVDTVLATLVGIAVATPLNYLVNHFWTFRAR